MSMGEEDARLIASGIVRAFKFIASGEVGAIPVRILRDPNEPMVDPDGRVRYVEQVYRDDFQHRIERDKARAMVRRLADALEKLAELGQMTKHYRDLIAEARAMGGKAE